MKNRNEFLKALTVKQETIRLETIDAEVTIKEANINESEKIEEARRKLINGEITGQQFIIETCRYAMVEPVFFTDEELANMSKQGFNILMEIFHRIPEIGMTDEQKEIYRKKLVENINEQVEKLAPTEEETTARKKPKKGSSIG